MVKAGNIRRTSHSTRNTPPPTEPKKGKLPGRQVSQMTPCTKVVLAAAGVAAAALVYYCIPAKPVNPSPAFDLHAELENAFDVIDLKLGYADRPAELSAAHLASVLDDPRALDLLHQAGNPIDEKDEFGFTPLHYMAMQGNLAGVRTLLDWGADPHHRNSLNGTYMDLLRLNEPSRKPSDFPLNPALFSAHKVHHTDIDLKCFPKGVTFITENVASPDQLFRMLGAIRHHTKDRKTLFDETEIARYEAFKKSPPHLSVEPIKHDDEGNPLNLGPTYCGVIARQAIKEGDVIAEYTGKMFADNVLSRSSNNEYLWDDWPEIDGSKFRSVGAMFNDGFPNAMVNPWFGSEKMGLDGVPYRKIITALEDIAAGDEITIFYGHKYDWSGQHTELRPGALKKYIKQNGWNYLIDNFEKVVKTRQGDLGKVARFLSILESSSALPELAKAKLITQGDFARIKATAKKYNL